MKWKRVRPLSVLFVIYFFVYDFFFVVLPFPVNSAIALGSILAHSSTNQPSAVAYIIRLQQRAVRMLQDCNFF